MPPNPWLLGRAWQSWQGAMYPQAWAPVSLPISASFLPTPFPAAGDPEQINSLSKDGVLWLGVVPSPLTTKDQRSRISTKEFAKAISLYFVFLPFNQFAQAEDEWILEGKEECVGTDPPGNSLCTLPRLVRLEKRFNNKLYRIRNVQKCQGSCWLVSCLPTGVRVTPVSPVQRSWGWPGGTARFLPRGGAVLLMQQKCVKGQAHGRMPRCPHPLRFCGF